MTSSPISLRDETGRVVLRGTQSPAGGGGSQPQIAEYVSSNPVSIGDGGSAALPLDTLAVGDALIDNTDPNNPFFVAAGVYFLDAVAVSTAPLTAGGYVRLTLNLGNLSGSLNTPGTKESTHPDGGWDVNSLAAADAGDIVQLSVQNHDGAASRDFSLAQLSVVKIS